MDSSLRIVGFTFSNHGESTLNVEISNAKLQTQRSLLSELLAIHAVGDEGLNSDSESQDSEDDDDENEYSSGTAPAQVVRTDTYGAQRTAPIPIPCPESFAKERAKDAYRRLIYQQQIKQHQLQYQAQQQQQLLLLQQQRRLLYLQQQRRQAAASKHKARQEPDVDVQSHGPVVTVPVY